MALLADAGSKASRTATPGHAALVRQLVLDALTEEQRRQLRDISGRILAATGSANPWRESRG